MKMPFFAGLLLALLLQTASANETQTWESLAVWNNHYPEDRLGVDRTNFFGIPAVSKGIKGILSEDDCTKLRKIYELSDSFSIVDHFLVGDQCRPHNCGAENVAMIFDLNGPDLWVAMYSHKGTIISTRWYGTADYSVLPPSVFSAVIAVHRPLN